MYTPEQIATACNVPIAAAEEGWPLLVNALHARKLTGRFVEIAVAANVAEETAHTFRPIEEFGNESYWRGELGEQWWYHGRGYNQRTWRDAYAEDGLALGLDLLNHPELLLIPANSAHDTALFVEQKGILALANAQDWYGVRRAWNGGLNGIDTVMAHVHALLAITPDPATLPHYDAPTSYEVTLVGALKQKPNHACGIAIGEHGHPVYLPIGQVLLPNGPPVTTGSEVWINVKLPPPSPVHGYYPLAHAKEVC